MNQTQYKPAFDQAIDRLMTKLLKLESLNRTQMVQKGFELLAEAEELGNKGSYKEGIAKARGPLA